MHTAHKIAFTWILYVLHYMYFNQFHHSSLLLLTNSFFPPSSWPILYTCTSNQANLCTCDSLRKDSQFYWEAIGMFHIICSWAWTYMHIYSPKKPLMMKHTYILVVLIDSAFIFVIFNSQIVLLFVRNSFTKSSLHFSSYFLITNPTKCHTVIYAQAHLQDARTTYTHIYIIHSNWQTSNKSKNICNEMSPVPFVNIHIIYIYFISIIKMNWEKNAFTVFRLLLFCHSHSFTFI